MKESDHIFRTLDQRAGRYYKYRKYTQRKLFTLGLITGFLWVTSIWVGGWLIFLFCPEAYDMLNDTVGLPLDEWWHVTFR